MEPAAILLSLMFCMASFVGGALFIESVQDIRATIEKCEKQGGVFVQSPRICISKNALIDISK